MYNVRKSSCYWQTKHLNEILPPDSLLPSLWHNCFVLCHCLQQFVHCIDFTICCKVQTITETFYCKCYLIIMFDELKFTNLLKNDYIWRQNMPRMKPLFKNHVHIFSIFAWFGCLKKKQLGCNAKFWCAKFGFCFTLMWFI